MRNHKFEFLRKLQLDVFQSPRDCSSRFDVSTQRQENRITVKQCEIFAFHLILDPSAVTLFRAIALQNQFPLHLYL
jgi:Zn-dependent peptidase ImmA (M78 family)